MPLTAAEKRELLELRRSTADDDDEERGSKHLEKVREARNPAQSRPPAQAARPFSIYRATVGALRDAGQGVIDTTIDIGARLFKTRGPSVSLPGPVGSAIDIFKGVAPGYSNMLSNLYSNKQVKAAVTLPTLEGEENAGGAERFVRGVGSFLVPFAGASRAIGIARSASLLGRIGRGVLAGAAVDFSQVDPVSGNIANMAKEFGILPDALESLAADDDDDSFDQRAKAALASAPIGVLGDLLFEAGAKGLRAYRNWKGTAEEADEIIKNIKSDQALNPAARDLVVPEAAAGAKPGAVDGGSLNRELATGKERVAGDAADAVDGEFTDIPKKEFNPKTDTGARAAPPENFEDVLEYIKRNIGDGVDLANEDVARFAENLLFGDPENALAKLGIDPAKLDFSAYDDPEVLGRLHKGLAEIYETYATRLGRSGVRVTEAATTAAARALASTPDTLKALHGSTTNLAEELTASRMFVGAHAHKLLSLADQAIKEISAGGAGPKWAEFMEAFHRQAYYLGTLRGAGSEVGRALRSLQTLVKANKPISASAAKDAGAKIAENAGEVAVRGAKGFQQGASDYADRLVTDAEKIQALTKLKLLGGDVGELSREVRRGNMSILKRFDAALKETMGNLFSVGTASYNLLAGGAMLGTRTMTRVMSTAMRAALAVGGGKEAGIAARTAFMDTWAYTHGIVAGFGEAYHNALLMLEKEGGAELSLNLDSMGLKDLARDVAAKRASAAEKLGERTFERADTETYRNFAILPHEQQAIQKLTQELPGPQFFNEGLAALARLGGAAINAAGSASRLGTILFINMPDQFIGTLAARAGAYSHSVRTAASEAAEFGLEGKELSTYLKARTVQLTEHPAGWNEDGFSAGVRESAANVGEMEAREVLFQDDLELGISKGMSGMLTGTPLMHLVVPFVKTPLRILERTAIDYTPLGLLKDRVRHAIAQGGPARDEAIARMSLGITAIATAYALADDRTIVGKDGGYTSSARLSRSSYSLKIGDDTFEFSRIDPFGTLLGFGADIREFYHNIEDDPDRDSALANATEAFVWATTANILSKTWLTSLRNLTDLAGATSEEDASSRVSRFIQSFATRFVPASGVQRQLEAMGDGVLRQAMTFTDGLIKGSLGAGTLPVRRDPLLGREVPLDGLTRLVGVRGGPGASEVDDPLGAEMERLSFQVPGSRRKVEGVSLSAAQFSRFLELKGQVVKDPNTGLTMEQTLDALIRLPEYQGMNDRQRVMAVREEMAGFTRLATDQLLREDKDFALAALRQEVYADVLYKQGGSPQDADAATKRLAAQLGL